MENMPGTFDHASTLLDSNAPLPTFNSATPRQHINVPLRYSVLLVLSPAGGSAAAAADPSRTRACPQPDTTRCEPGPIAATPGPDTSAMTRSTSMMIKAPEAAQSPC